MFLLLSVAPYQLGLTVTTAVSKCDCYKTLPHTWIRCYLNYLSLMVKEPVYTGSCSVVAGMLGGRVLFKDCTNALKAVFQDRFLQFEIILKLPL